MQKLFTLFLVVGLGFATISAGSKIPQVFRIGGMELPPYGVGNLVVQPHRQIDSTNTAFANYYARISLWLGGITAAGHTLVTCGDYIGLSSAAGFFYESATPDSTNILQLPHFDQSVMSCYTDSSKGWLVKQYTLSVQDHSYGVILYEIEYNGNCGPLSNVFA
ncbi:MAG: hypothetical protein WAN36_04065, partial [Calditrichia bacterium]